MNEQTSSYSPFFPLREARMFQTLISDQKKFDDMFESGDPSLLRNFLIGKNTDGKIVVLLCV